MSGVRREYRGRFAPSPTGPLHFGSLVAAVGSYLEARAHHGVWLLRIEDVDAPRCSRAAADSILRTLTDFGFEWDGPVVWQSQRLTAYATALEQLQQLDHAFPCACSRKELADSSLGLTAADGGAIYPGTCRDGLPAGREARSWRLRVDSNQVAFRDVIQGRIEADLAATVGDFVVKRADGLFAYQLAVVVDDVEAGITDIVRGADLLDSTPRQILLQRILGCPTPTYAHLPVVLDGNGEKLSKQTLAQPVDTAQPTASLYHALDFLGQSPPQELSSASLPDLWLWAHKHWKLSNVPRNRGRIYNAMEP